VKGNREDQQKERVEGERAPRTELAVAN